MGVAPPPNERSLTHIYELDKDKALRMDDLGVQVSIEIPWVTPHSARRRANMNVSVRRKGREKVSEALDPVVAPSKVETSIREVNPREILERDSVALVDHSNKRKATSHPSELTCKVPWSLREGLHQPPLGTADSPYSLESASIATDTSVGLSSRNLISSTDMMMAMADGWAYIGDGDCC
ncbi:hypothetical protein Q3G72_010203 [Acer saccharum]|nr:hypothetical protein Q3G72_010203 [Acer saccharum]